VRTFASFSSLFMGLVDEQGQIDYYDGRLRVVDADGKIVADGLDPTRYQEFVGEAVDPQSYLKPTYYKPAGYPDGLYRVGPLARLNVASGYPGPRAAHEWAEFRQLSQGPVLGSFYYHHARLIEILDCLERMEALLDEPDILDPHVRAHAEPNRREGIGVAEAPRGTLLHHYRIDEDGLITWVNLIIATGHNALAMNRGVLQVAREFVAGDRLQEGVLNRVEAVIRTFDPCLSCSTHALGHMPLRVELRGADGTLLHQLVRD
jgi:NAD-reducing hydrogenase large subunit